MSASEVTLRDVYRARKRVAAVVRRSPLVRSETLSERIGAAVHL
ncbi:MAG: hypothetical protein O7A68_00830 [Alphaproteobacteria bacterium]|nr:hypothetical protein [Alphaproteobacteria bacterium]